MRKCAFGHLVQPLWFPSRACSRRALADGRPRRLWLLAAVEDPRFCGCGSGLELASTGRAGMRALGGARCGITLASTPIMTALRLFFAMRLYGRQNSQDGIDHFDRS
jgi:hypothetical protein